MCHKGPLVATAWHDSKIVFILLSLHANEQDVVSLCVRMDEHFTHKSNPCSEAVCDYRQNESEWSGQGRPAGLLAITFRTGRAVD